VQALSPPDHRARVVFCQRLLTKYAVNTQFVASILFTDEAGFIRECTVNFRNGHVWVDDNLHTTVASRRQHRLSISVWMSILGDQPIGLVVLPHRLTGAVYHCLFVSDLPVI
jgi:hypothetical protein